MPTLAGMATTYDLPNYAGDLLLASPTDTPFLRAIGGLSLDRDDQERLIVTSTEFGWQTEDLDAPSQPNILEGADPSISERTRANLSNVVQIFQYGVQVSYTKLAAYNQLATNGNGQSNPVQNELDHQIGLKLMVGARDINHTFINGAYNKPANNATARRTRGILAAITTNVIANGTAADLTEDMVLTLLQNVWTARGIYGAFEPTLMVGAAQKRRLSKIFITDKGYSERSRTVGGVNVQEIETDFGRINIMLERAMPADQVAFVHLGVCEPKFLLIPGKGFFFVEPLAKTGAYEKYQLYGEIGLAYGDEGVHGKITGLTV